KVKRRRVRARARCRAFDDLLEDPDAVGGPVGDEGLADDPSTGLGSPEAAVIAFATVVAHHEVMIRRNPDRLRQIADSAVSTGPNVGLVELDNAVDDRMSIADGQCVPR